MSKPSEPTDRLRRHAEDLRLWEHAAGHHTGPKTEAGKARSAQRSRKHGLRSADGEAMNRWLASLNLLARTLTPSA